MDEWEIPYHEMILGKEMARGAFAVVHRGTWRGIEVAIKRLENLSAIAVEDQKNELRILKLVHHPNIVLFLGYAQKDDRLFLVFEWMHGGNLLDAVRTGWTSRTQQIQWSRNLCTAVLYLHQRTPTRIIHRDLKPSNCLLDRNGMCKIIDFGISKTVFIQKKRSLQNIQAMHFDDPPSPDTSVYGNDVEIDASTRSRGPVGTFRYMAPELMMDLVDCSGIRSSEYIDIYSLGMLLYIIWEEKEPFWDYPRHDIQTFCADVCDGLRPQFSPRTPPEIQVKIMACWESNPWNRPRAQDLLLFFSSSSFSHRGCCTIM
jgi:serine/threonine protein kinase